MYKVITDPKTGKMSTTEIVGVPTKESLARQRKELRDMLDGNTQFHKDNLGPGAPPPAPEKKDEQSDDDEDNYFYFAPYGF